MATINFTNALHSDVIKAIRKYKNTKAKIAELEAELDELKGIIVQAMGDNDTATTQVGGVALTVTNKAVTSTRLDTKAVKVKYPAIWEECSVTSTACRFVIK